jgi:hypothetical protein
MHPRRDTPATQNAGESNTCTYTLIVKKIPAANDKGDKPYQRDAEKKTDQYKQRRHIEQWRTRDGRPTKETSN